MRRSDIQNRRLGPGRQGIHEAYYLTLEDRSHAISSEVCWTSVVMPTRSQGAGLSLASNLSRAGWLAGMICAVLPACHRQASAGVQMTPQDAGGAWSADVAGVRGRLLATPAQTTDGPRQLRLEVELENVSDVAAPIEIWWTDVEGAVTFSLEDEAGNAVPETGIGGNHLSPLGHWLRLESRSATRMVVTPAAYEYVRPGVTLLRPVTFQAWDLSQPSTAKLYLRARLAPGAAEGSVPRRNWKGPLELPRVVLP
jgi:hypothetical protein